MSAKIKVFTFNLRVEAKVDGINIFDNRRGRILDTIREYSPDVIGFQEANDKMREWLIDSLSDYFVVGCGRLGDWRGESTVLAFKKHMFEMISLENRWLSATPDIPGSTFGGDQSSCPRMFTAVLLKHREAEKPFIFLNTHLDHKSEPARVKQIKVLLDFIEAKCRDYPVVLSGDFNTTPTSDVYKTVLKSFLSDSADVAMQVKRASTFTNYGKSNKTLDYLFVNAAKMSVASYDVCNEKINGDFPSDHHPVLIKYIIND